MLCGGITVVSVCVVWWLQRRRRRCVEIPLRVQWLRTGNAAAASTRHLPIWASALVLLLLVLCLLLLFVSKLFHCLLFSLFAFRFVLLPAPASHFHAALVGFCCHTQRMTLTLPASHVRSNVCATEPVCVPMCVCELCVCAQPPAFGFLCCLCCH